MLSDGRGSLARGVVADVRGDALSVAVSERRHVPPPAVRLVVVQALPKGERAEAAVEMMTELGVDEIVPWAAARSVVHWEGARGERAREKWQRTAREAAKQSRRAWIPLVAPLASTAEVAQRLGRATAIVLHEAAAEGLGAVRLPERGDVLVVVGPEGGVAEPELAAFDAAGAVAARLGEPVLRSSTAGAAALAALSVRLGRWT
jgi:16S rRNA (uracil1498-N3)-methyltransferase